MTTLPARLSCFSYRIALFTFLLAGWISCARGDLLLTVNSPVGFMNANGEPGERCRQFVILGFNDHSGIASADFFYSGCLSTDSVGESRVGPDGHLYLMGFGLGFATWNKIHGQTGARLELNVLPLDPSRQTMGGPSAFDISSDGKLIVACAPRFWNNIESEGSVWVLDAKSFQVLGFKKSIRIGIPSNLVALPDGYFVGEDSGNLLWGQVNSSNRIDIGRISGYFSSNTSSTDWILGPDQYIYISRYGSNDIQRFKVGPGLNLFPIENFIPPHTGGLNGPTAMTFGPDGNLYVVSWNTKSILRYDGNTGAFIDVFAQITQDLPSIAANSYQGIADLHFMPPAPVLRSTRTADGFVLKWPRTWTNYVLETQTAAPTSNAWTLHSNTPSEVGTDWVLTNSISAPMQFFRLKRSE